MRAVVQRVNSAKLKVDNVLISEIENGLIVMVGITSDDDETTMQKMAYRIATLRIFKDETDKLRLNVKDVNGKVLLVSNFTLCSTKKGGTRPDFSLSAPKDKAFELYNKLAQALEKEYKIETKLGRFAEHMHIDANLDGPVTIFLDTLD